MSARARIGNKHWTPTDSHGWYRCQVNVLAFNGLVVNMTCDLWWNEDSLGSGWFVGQPGNCYELNTVFNKPQVLMGIRLSCSAPD